MFMVSVERLYSLVKTWNHMNIVYQKLFVIVTSENTFTKTIYMIKFYNKVLNLHFLDAKN